MYKFESMYRIVLLSVAVSLSACSSDGEERPEYLDSTSVAALEIPPQLTGPNGLNEMQLPRPSDKALMAFKQRDGMEGKVAPIFKGITLKSDQGMYWLEVEQSADQLWSELRNFWANEGIELERDEPMLGLMETEWVKEYQAKRDVSFFKRVFNVLSADFMDKFRLRLERVNNQLTRVYISHRGLEKVVLDDGTRWKSRASDAALEKEMYYRLALFKGMSDVQANDMFAAYVPYQSRVKVLDASQGQYEVTGQVDFVWQRLLLAVDRMGAEITQQDKAQAKMQVRVIAEKMPVMETEPEVTGESGWIWTDTPKKTAPETVEYDTDGQAEVAVMIRLQSSDSNTRMQISEVDGSTIVDGLAWNFKTGLVTVLK
ncbi:MAG TPA: outer membrane protein assembly factor BamC [Gammaproteobacteria bacterium]